MIDTCFHLLGDLFSFFLFFLTEVLLTCNIIFVSSMQHSGRSVFKSDPKQLVFLRKEVDKIVPKMTGSTNSVKPFHGQQFKSPCVRSLSYLPNLGSFNSIFSLETLYTLPQKKKKKKRNVHLYISKGVFAQDFLEK